MRSICMDEELLLIFRHTESLNDAFRNFADFAYSRPLWMQSSLSITIPPGAALKQNLAAQHSRDREAYTTAKSDYGNAVMAKARAAGSMRKF